MARLPEGGDVVDMADPFDQALGDPGVQLRLGVAVGAALVEAAGQAEAQGHAGGFQAAQGGDGDGGAFVADQAAGHGDDRHALGLGHRRKTVDIDAAAADEGDLLGADGAARGELFAVIGVFQGDQAVPAAHGEGQRPGDRAAQQIGLEPPRGEDIAEARHGREPRAHPGEPRHQPAIDDRLQRDRMDDVGPLAAEQPP